ncbi:MAG: glycosyltransferase [Candidatus Korobacteraceae bacterium]
METWLVQLLGQVDRSQYQMDFLVHTIEPGAYDAEVKRLGARIIPCLYTDRPLQYARAFRRILKIYGPYDCVHSHVHHYSGYVLLLARLQKVPIRIAHSHTGKPESQAGLLRKTYLSAMRSLIDHNATAGVVVSKVAGDSLNPSWLQDQRWRLLPYGIDMSRFDNADKKVELRSQLGIKSAGPVVGHVGRFVDVKNHKKFVEVAAELSHRNPGTHFLLVGDGPLRSQVEQHIAAAGLTNRFTLTGNRADVPQLLQSAMDVFVFPSKYEGLPIALMEAQLAGLPCVASDAITPEAALDEETVKWMALSSPAADWANAVDKATQASRHALSREKREGLSIEACCRKVVGLYDQLAAGLS